MSSKVKFGPRTVDKRKFNNISTNEEPEEPIQKVSNSTVDFQEEHKGKKPNIFVSKVQSTRGKIPLTDKVFPSNTVYTRQPSAAARAPAGIYEFDMNQDEIETWSTPVIESIKEIYSWCFGIISKKQDTSIIMPVSDFNELLDDVRNTRRQDAEIDAKYNSIEVALTNLKNSFQIITDLMSKIFEDNPEIRKKYVKAVLSKIDTIDGKIYLRPLSAPASPARKSTYKDSRKTQSQEFGHVSFFPRDVFPIEKLSTTTLHDIYRNQKLILITEMDKFFSIFGKKDRKGNVQTKIYGPSQDAQIWRELTPKIIDKLDLFPEDEVRLKLMKVGIVKEVVGLIQVIKRYQSVIIEPVSTQIDASSAELLNSAISTNDIDGIAQVFSESSSEVVFGEVDMCNAGGGGSTCRQILKTESKVINTTPELVDLKQQIKDAEIFKLNRGEITKKQKEKEFDKKYNKFIELAEKYTGIAIKVVAGAVIQSLTTEEERILRSNEYGFEDQKIRFDANKHFIAFYKGAEAYFKTYEGSLIYSIFGLLSRNPDDELDFEEVEVFPVGLSAAVPLSAAAARLSGGRRKGTRKGTRKGARRH